MCFKTSLPPPPNGRFWSLSTSLNKVMFRDRSIFTGQMGRPGQWGGEGSCRVPGAEWPLTEPQGKGR